MTGEPSHATLVLQMIFKKKSGQRRHHSRLSVVSTLRELREGQHGILESIELPAEARRRVMEMGFLPGSLVTAAASAPGGDPRVFRVDGSEVALRLETAGLLKLRN